MMPDTPLEERITKQWGDLGFQGKDPQTDFRGMGMLCFVLSTLSREVGGWVKAKKTVWEG